MPYKNTDKINKTNRSLTRDSYAISSHIHYEIIRDKDNSKYRNKDRINNDNRNDNK
jgi:hypothetical protein